MDEATWEDYDGLEKMYPQLILEGKDMLKGRGNVKTPKQKATGHALTSTSPCQDSTPAALLASLDCLQTKSLVNARPRSPSIRQRTALTKSFDFIIDTASGDHPFDAYMSLLKTAGVLVLVGAPSEVKVSPASLLLGMKTITGSQVGGTKDTREMINICATHKIYPEIEVIPIQYVNEAIERLIKSDVKYRFVIDIENSLK
ncbi:probable cinnamyl alcohol dehydrogenase 1 [Carya illinoinensis]|uniref:probable cinnamyl alcohol dehydrogenase 1 n=1 Tax=Carya illinoinensis TaxID=32201 RepID=UPI001C717FEC|nr:probable cinnamyl alcohol dehydrogenase 1 [Carya illinoinensis]